MRAGSLLTGIRWSAVTLTVQGMPAFPWQGVFSEESVPLTDLIDHITTW